MIYIKKFDENDSDVITHSVRDYFFIYYHFLVDFFTYFFQEIQD